MAAFPTFPENPGIGPNYSNRYFLGMTRETQNTDQGFEIVTHLLSPAYQLENSRNGWITALNDTEVQAAYGQNIPELKDKNLQALFYNEPGELVPILDVPLWREVHTFAREVITEIALGEKEVDQGLAYLEEKINEMIQN